MQTVDVVYFLSTPTLPVIPTSICFYPRLEIVFSHGWIHRPSFEHRHLCHLFLDFSESDRRTDTRLR